jgi:hypothetical protein
MSLRIAYRREAVMRRARPEHAWWWVCLMRGVGAGCGPTTPVEITPATLPAGVVDSEYRQVLTATNVEQAAWEISAGILPPGLRLDTGSGAIAGTPTQTGSFTFTVVARATTLPFPLAEVSYTLTIVPRLTVSTDLPAARVGQSYRHQFIAGGGVPPYQFALVGLTAGIGFDGSTGTISGTPVVAVNDVQLELTVTDSGQPPQTLVEPLLLDIQPPAVRITTADLPAGKVGVAYSVQLTAEAGQPPYHWAVVSGLLPGGLHLNLSTGAITGTPTTAQTQSFEIRVTDDDSPPSTDAKSFTLTIEP